MLAFKLDNRAHSSLSIASKGTPDLDLISSFQADLSLFGLEAAQARDSFRLLDADHDFRKRISHFLEQLPPGAITPQQFQVVHTAFQDGMGAISPKDMRVLGEALQIVGQADLLVPLGLSFQDLSRIRTMATQLLGDTVSISSTLIHEAKEDDLTRLGISPQESFYRDSRYLVDQANPEIERISRTLMLSGVINVRMTNEEIAALVLNYVQTHYTYAKDEIPALGKPDKWQQIEETVLTGRGDCEDLAILQAALLGNVLGKKGYSASQISQMVTVSAGYMTQETASDRLVGTGHAVAKFRDLENGKTLALDATGDKGPIEWSTFGMDEVFELNKDRFVKFKEIGASFHTALQLSSISAEGLMERIVTSDRDLRRTLSASLDIPSFSKKTGFTRTDPISKVSYEIGEAAPPAVLSNLGAINAALGEGLSFVDASGNISGDTRFFKVEKQSLSGAPPTVDGDYYTTKIKPKEFRDYFINMREGTNRTMFMYSLLQMNQGQLYTIVADLFVDDEEALKDRNKKVKEFDKGTKKLFSSVHKYYQQLNQGVQQVMDELMNFVRGANQAQFSMLRMRVEFFGQENPAAGILTEMVNEATGAFEFVRAGLLYQVSRAEFEVATYNTEQITKEASFIGEGIQLIDPHASASIDNFQPWISKRFYQNIKNNFGVLHERSQAFLANTVSQVNTLGDILLSVGSGANKKSDYEALNTAESRLGVFTPGTLGTVATGDSMGDGLGALFQLSSAKAPHNAMGVLAPKVFLDLNTERTLLYRTQLTVMNNFVSLVVSFQQHTQALMRDIVASWSGKAILTSGSTMMSSGVQDEIVTETNKQSTLVDNMSSSIHQMTMSANSLIKSRVDLYKASVQVPTKSTKFTLDLVISVLAPVLSALNLGLFAAIKPLFDALATGYNTVASSVLKFAFALGDLMLEVDTPGYSRPQLMQNASKFKDELLTAGRLASESGPMVLSKYTRNIYSPTAVDKMGKYITKQFYDARALQAQMRNNFLPTFVEDRGDKMYSKNGFKEAAVESASRHAQQLYQVWLMVFKSTAHVIRDLAVSVGGGRKIIFWIRGSRCFGGFFNYERA